VHDPSAHSSRSTLSLDALWSELSGEQRELLVRYTDLVHHYNAAANLTGLRTRPEILSSLVKESLALWPFLGGLKPGKVADIGSGAGVPGIPLAVAIPGTRFTLYERSEKKASFLRIALAALQLENAAAMAADPFAAPPDTRFHAVVTRSALPPEELIPAAREILVPGGSLLGFASEPMLEALREHSGRLGCGLSLAQYARPGEAGSFVYALKYGGPG